MIEGCCRTENLLHKLKNLPNKVKGAYPKPGESPKGSKL